MRPSAARLLLFGLAALAAVGPARSARAEEVGRFALVVGSNRGLVDEEALRFAEEDALKVRGALIDVGGFSPAQVTQLDGATAESLRAALRVLKASMGEGPHERLVVYVSSHAADGALHLGGTEFPLAELVDFVKAAPVRVGLLVLDACQSGRVTRLKGLTPADTPPTRLEASSVEGRVLLSSSGADEYAQESDALRGSYFTHHLVTGLRGAADASRDGQVTLEEAYAWAWARTIEATFASRAGVQRPAYSVELRGAGELVLAEPRRSASRLVLAVEPPGRWLVVAEATGRVFAELDKAAGPLALALPPGAYRLRLRTAEGLLERSVVVPARGVVTVTGDELDRASLVRVAKKGGGDTRLVLSAAGGVASGLVAGLGVEPGAELRLRRDGPLWGPLNHLTATALWRAAGARSGAFGQTELELRLGVGHRFPWERWSLALSLEAGPLLVLQYALPDGSSRQSLALTAQLALELRVRVLGPVDVVVLGTSGGAVVKKLAGVTLAPRLTASVGLGVVF
jgi:hypothetical protein